MSIPAHWMNTLNQQGQHSLLWVNVWVFSINQSTWGCVFLGLLASEAWVFGSTSLVLVVFVGESTLTPFLIDTRLTLRHGRSDLWIWIRVVDLFTSLWKLYLFQFALRFQLKCLLWWWLWLVIPRASLIATVKPFNQIPIAHTYFVTISQNIKLLFCCD